MYWYSRRSHRDSQDIVIRSFKGPLLRPDLPTLPRRCRWLWLRWSSVGSWDVSICATSRDLIGIEHMRYDRLATEAADVKHSSCSRQWLRNGEFEMRVAFRATRRYVGDLRTRGKNWICRTHPLEAKGEVWGWRRELIANGNPNIPCGKRYFMWIANSNVEEIIETERGNLKYRWEAPSDFNCTCSWVLPWHCYC